MLTLKQLKTGLLAGAICLPLLAGAQNAAKPNWYNLDLKADGVFGISTEKAYDELLKNKPHVPVIVAVIDGGEDINHEDLKPVLWTNPREIAGNNLDDDKNGHIDDIHGWSFIGSPAKGNVKFDNLELVRLLKHQAPKYENIDPSTLKKEDEAGYKNYLAMKAEREKLLEKQQKRFDMFTRFKTGLVEIKAALKKDNLTVQDFTDYKPEGNTQTWVRKTMINALDEMDYATFVKEEIEDPLEHASQQLNYHLNLAYDPRQEIVGDNYADSYERNYGTPDVTGPHNEHGTHVAGIVGAVRDNNIGIKGVANDVKIMVVQSTPEGDERDKDVGNAIRYAAENGAKVINMSFGKDYTWDKKAVDDAVKFAVSKDVLIVHGAGNSNTDNDNTPHYPTRYYADKSGEAATWIEVGASGITNDETLKAKFSCYGKQTVDVFAPGVDINSCAPGSTYAVHSGTSMASPVVAGLAALIRSYYPKLTALQVKEVILKSVTPVDRKVILTDGEKESKVAFTELCKSGGIVNAYNALKLAATY